MTQIRAVLDTNCIVSALLFSANTASQLRNLWQLHKFTPILCKETAEELIRVLAYPKFHLEKSEINALLSEFLPFAEICLYVSERPVIPGLADYDDAIFIWLANEAKADYLVSGDKHLLSLKNSCMFSPIVTLSDFIFRLNQNLS